MPDMPDMPDMPATSLALTVSVVIPNLHSPIIDQVVQAVEQQTARHLVREIVVVGQDCHGRVPASVRYIETPRPLSAAAARNLGARATSSDTDMLLFLDADCIAAPDLVQHMVARFAQGCQVVGGAVVLEAAPYWALCDNMLTFAPFFSTEPAGPVPALPSLNMAIARALFLSLGGFDERFPGAAGEDYDLCARLRLQGHTLHFEPRARVAHRHQRMTARATWNHLRNFGRAQMRLQRSYGTLTAPRLTPRLRPLSGAILAGAPLLALWDTLHLYRAHPHFVRFWHALPGIVWGKTAWYWGVAESLML